MDATDRRIINALQGGFPLSERPFADAAAPLGLTEAELLERLAGLRERGAISRFGPMYNAERLGGAVTLAAMAVPEERFKSVAGQVNAYPEVAHNYQRDHPLNMWFVVAVDDPARLPEVLADIERDTGLTVYDLPKEEEYFLELKLEARP
mgnify:CR=1 FL=1